MSSVNLDSLLPMLLQFRVLNWEGGSGYESKLFLWQRLFSQGYIGLGSEPVIFFLVCLVSFPHSDVDLAISVP